MHYCGVLVDLFMLSVLAYKIVYACDEFTQHFKSQN